MSACFAAMALTITLTLTGCQKDVPKSQLPHLGTFCVANDKWDSLIAIMKRFASSRGLDFRGGVEEVPDGKPLFNAYVARGYSYWFEDDLDLWFVSNPFKAGSMDLNGVAKHPWSQRDADTVKALIVAIEPLHCEATANVR